MTGTEATQTPVTGTAVSPSTATVSLQARYYMQSKKVDHHGERCTVPEGISCEGADLLRPA